MYIYIHLPDISTDGYCFQAPSLLVMISTRFHHSAAEAALKSTSHAPILGFAAKKQKKTIPW